MKQSELVKSLERDVQKLLTWVAPTLVMLMRWAHAAPFQSPVPTPEAEKLAYRVAGVEAVPLEQRKLLYGDMHRHIAQYLADRGIAPKDGEYKNGFRQEPFPTDAAKEVKS
jgi:hypothetical protein